MDTTITNTELRKLKELLDEESNPSVAISPCKHSVPVSVGATSTETPLPKVDTIQSFGGLCNFGR